MRGKGGNLWERSDEIELEESGLDILREIRRQEM